MESEMYSGIDFEHTLDGVLFEKYDHFLSNEYYVNIPYLINKLDVLIKLRDVVIPHKMIPLKRIRAAVGNRTGNDYKSMDDTESSGIYEWECRFSRDYYRTIDERREDDIRLALDIVKKYPEHADLVLKREE